MPFVKSVIFVVRTMKRVGIILTFVFCLLLTSCGDLRDLSVTSFRVVSAGMSGDDGVDITLEVQIDNPSSRVEVSDMEATVKILSKAVVLLSCDDLIIHRRSEDMYLLPCKAKAAEGVGVLKLLRLIKGGFTDSKEVLVDVRAKVKVGVVKRSVEYTDIPIDTIIKDF